MMIRRVSAMRGRCWMGWAAVLLSACAHDPAPKARCHGPWIWLTPAAGSSAGPADGSSADGMSSSPTTKRDDPPRPKTPAASSEDVPPAGPVLDAVP
jgi:hypothetical protein